MHLCFADCFVDNRGAVCFRALRKVVPAAMYSLVLLSALATASAQDVKNPPAADTKRIPPAGIEVPTEKRAALQQELDALESQIAELQRLNVARIRALVPDVAIYWKAVHTALADNEFYKSEEFEAAFDLLRMGRERIEQIKRNEMPWTLAKGLVVRGYVSRLDGSVQPYGLVVPPSYTPTGKEKYRLDFWFHGRNEKLSELNFLRDRMKNAGTFAPSDTIVLHPYGRYCNANKFAGEVDVFEALESVRHRYRIDEDRITVRGFSMGGASTWHLAVHYPTYWAAANPGAGFAETPKFAKTFHKETLNPTWWETKLFHLYDCPEWAGNLWQCPTVAYSGELDSQKQAADVMAEAMKKEGLDLVHVIGPQTKHRYEPQAREEVDRRIGALAEVGRQRFPESIRFTTYTLRYNHCAWITVDALQEHWSKARIEAHPNEGGIAFITENVKAFTIDIPPGFAPIRPSVAGPIPVQFFPADEHSTTEPQILPVAALTRSDRSWSVSFHREGQHWAAGPLPDGLRKKHGLQGPIDDAFLDAFVFVRPTSKSANAEIDAWTRREMDRAIDEWRRQFRGVPRVKDDNEITDKDVASMNLVLWGDPASNSVYGRIAKQLPIRIDGESLVAGPKRFDAANHVPILVYPNPLNPQRYVVLNSGFTFREHAYRSNSFQVPELPDWAIVDVRTQPDENWPGRIVAADFFDESWKIKMPPPLEKPGPSVVPPPASETPKGPESK